MHTFNKVSLRLIVCNQLFEYPSLEEKRLKIVLFVIVHFKTKYIYFRSCGTQVHEEIRKMFAVGMGKRNASPEKKQIHGEALLIHDYFWGETFKIA